MSRTLPRTAVLLAATAAALAVAPAPAGAAACEDAVSGTLHELHETTGDPGGAVHEVEETYCAVAP